MKVRYTVPSAVARVAYVGNGVTQVFSVPFNFFEDSDLNVILVTDATSAEAVQALTANYTVSGGEGENGSVTMLVAPPTGTTLVIERDIPYTQEIDLEPNDPFPAEVTEEGFDRTTMLAQQTLLRAKQTPKLPASFDPDNDDPITLPLPESGKVLVGNASETGWEHVEIADLVPVDTPVLGPFEFGDSLYYDDIGAVFRPVKREYAPEMFGAVGDGVTDDTAAFAAMVVLINTTGGEVNLGLGKYLVDAGTIVFTRDGIIMRGRSKGNPSNLSPATEAPSSIIIKGSGAGIRMQAQSIILEDFRLTSNAARAALTFDITSPGIRHEASDTSASTRADRGIVRRLRIDKHPGDGILTVGPITASEYHENDIFECQGYGMRQDDGSLTGIVRTYPHYPGLVNAHKNRVGFCGGGAYACSNPTVTTQAGMGIRINLRQWDSFGNGIDPAIMYLDAAGNHYDFWLFAENSSIRDSAPCGRTGLSLTDEQMGGVYVAGRDIDLVNNRYIGTNQPICVGYVAAQPSKGITVDGIRTSQTSLTIAELVKVEAGAAGVGIRYDAVEGAFTNPITKLDGCWQHTLGHWRSFGGTQTHGAFNSSTIRTIADDAVAQLAFDMAGTSASGLLAVSADQLGGGPALIAFRVGSSGYVDILAKPSSINVTAGAAGVIPTGTTGVDGDITYYPYTNNIMYIENRSGLSRNLRVTVLAMHGTNDGLSAGQ